MKPQKAGLYWVKLGLDDAEDRLAFAWVSGTAPFLSVDRCVCVKGIDWKPLWIKEWLFEVNIPIEEVKDEHI